MDPQWIMEIIILCVRVRHDESKNMCIVFVFGF